MNQPAEKPRFGVELPAVRRFELGDITQHSKWLLARLVKQYPHLTQQTAYGFLNNALYNSEYYFCYQPHAAGLVQVERVQTLAAEPLVREKFVWCEDPKNPDHVEEAAAFYTEFAGWAKRLGAGVMLVKEASDVPVEMIRKAFDARVFTREQHFVRINA